MEFQAPGAVSIRELPKLARFFQSLLNGHEARSKLDARWTETTARGECS